MSNLYREKEATLWIVILKFSVLVIIIKMLNATHFLSWNNMLTFDLGLQNDIRKNPTFRSQFHEMCAKVGVDPLASNKGFWAELLGIGDFYYELGWYILSLSWWIS